MLGRAENRCEYFKVFVRFHFFILLASRMSFKRLVDVFFIAFWGLGITFSDFEGLGSELDGWMDAGWPSGWPEAPRTQSISPVEGLIPLSRTLQQQTVRLQTTD